MSDLSPLQHVLIWQVFFTLIGHNYDYSTKIKFIYQNKTFTMPVIFKVKILRDWTGVVLPHSWGSKAKASDPFARHAVLSCAVLTHSATGSSVQSLMSCVQCLRSLPCFLVPAIRPWRMEVQILCARTTCPKYRSFLRCMSFSSRASISVQFF